MKARPSAAALLAALAMAPCFAVCPADPSAPAETLLSLRFAAQPPIRLGARELAAFPARQATQRRTVSAPASSPAIEQQIVYGGIPLVRLVAGASGEDRQARDQRTWTFEAVATDGYRAVFSWGELFNADAAEQVLVVQTQDGRPLDAFEGPLALRALADRRPGPRHVRNLCAVIARPLPALER